MIILSNYANWTPVTYANLSAPHITPTNLNKNEEALTNITSELNSYNATSMKQALDYGIENNVKEIHNFENISDFTTTGTMSLGQATSSGVISGIGGITMQSNTASASSIGVYDNITSIDLTAYPSGASASISDYIVLCFNVSDSTVFTTLLLRLGDDDSNCYYKYMSLSTGWNFYKAKKSDFGTDGTPSGWDDITFVRIYVSTKNNSQSDYIILNKLYLIRRISDTTIPSSLMVNDGSGNYNTNMYLTGDEYIVMYYDKKIGKKGLHNARPYPYDKVVIMNDVNSFSFKCEMYSKIDYYGGTILWYIDYNNWASIAIENDLTIYEYINGSGSYVVVGTLSSNIEAGDRMELWIDKTADNIIRARLEVDGMKPVYAEYACSFASTLGGDLAITHDNVNQYYFLTDYVASNNPSIPLSNWSKAINIIVTKYYDQSLSSSTTLQNDNELFIKLPSNSLFEVELVLIYSCTSVTLDMKVAWSASGDYELFSDGRSIIATGSDTTSYTDINAYMNSYALPTAITVGTAATGELPHFEKILIKTGDSGCKLQLQLAKHAVSATPLQIDKGSYIKAIKL
jgi:hypothetical protein